MRALIFLDLTVDSIPVRSHFLPWVHSGVRRTTRSAMKLVAT